MELHFEINVGLKLSICVRTTSCKLSCYLHHCRIQARPIEESNTIADKPQTW